MQKGKLIFKNLDVGRYKTLMAAGIVLRALGCYFRVNVSSDSSEVEWFIDEETSGIELEVEQEPVTTIDCTCPRIPCCKNCCPHRYDNANTPTWTITYSTTGGKNA